jgi:hypothetical protein
MSIESAADRLDFIQTLAGITTDDCTVHHPLGKFDAIFDNEYLEALGGIGPAIEGRAPVLRAQTSDVEQLRKDTPLRIGDVEYHLRHHEPDGTGMSLVYLKK